MEVHAHTHTARKKWTHYFWEFLMLFLAVTLGFLVENKREHIIEGHRAKDYAKALLSDLVADTVKLSDGLQTLTDHIKFQDTLEAALVKKLSGQKVPGAYLYYYTFWGPGTYQFSVKTATLNQLKSSGSLRYFRNFEIIQLINEYDQAIQVQVGRENVDLSSFERLREARETLFNFYHHRQLEQWLNDDPASRDSILRIDLPLMNNSQEILSQMAYALSVRKTNLRRREMEYYRNPYNVAKKLIEVLKKAYNLK